MTAENFPCVDSISCSWSSKIHQKQVNRSLENLQAGFTHTQGVKICQQACARDGCLTPICRNVMPDIFDLLRLSLMLSFLTMKRPN